MKNMPILQRTALGNYGEDQHEGSWTFFYKIFFFQKTTVCNVNLFREGNLPRTILCVL